MRGDGVGLRRTLGGLLFKALASPFEKICRLVVLAVAAPLLGASAFGRFQFASTVTSMLAAITGFGLGTWTTRALAAGQSADEVLASGVRLRSWSVLPFTVLLLFSVLLERSSETRSAMLVFGAGALLQSFVDYFGAVLRGREDFKGEATMNAARAIFTTGGGLGGLVWVRSLLALGIGLLVGAVASLLFALRVVRHLYRRPLVRPLPEETRAVVRQAVPLWLAGLLATLYFRSDILFVQYFAGDAEVGSYAAAYRIFEATMLLPSVVMAVAFPRLVRARIPGAGRSGAELSLALLLTAAGFLVASALLLADASLVQRLLGPTFERSARPLAILAYAIPVMFLTYAVSDFVLARGKERALVVVLGAMLVLNVCLNLVLVPRLGGRGAAWSTLVTEVALVACSLALVARAPASRVAVAG